MSSDEKTAKKKTSSKRKSKADELKSKLESLDTELAESKDKFIRLYAEFDNYKKRTVRERLDLIKTAGSDLISDLLPVLDDFDRAKKSAEDETSNEVFSEGVTLVYNKIYGILKGKGLEAMETNGHDFDPELHEAITEIPAPTEDLRGKILDTIAKGYTLNSKIIRHAKVVVGK